MHYHQCICTVAVPRNTNSKMTNFKSQHRPFPKLRVGFRCLVLPSCTLGGILHCCNPCRPCANFCKAPVMNCVGSVLVPNDGATQYQSWSCLLCRTGRRMFNSLFSVWNAIFTEKNMKEAVWIPVCYSPCLLSQCLLTSRIFRTL